MKKMVLLIFIFPAILLAQNTTDLKSVWISDGRCDLGSFRLEIKEDNLFLLASIYNTIEYGKYVINNDTLELNVTHVRDYYEGAGEKVVRNARWRFKIDKDRLIPFYHSIKVNDNDNVIVNKHDENCTLKFIKKLKLDRF